MEKNKEPETDKAGSLRSRFGFAALTIFLISVVFLTSCYTEQSIARRFVKSVATDGPAVWFIGADYLYKTCKMEDDSTIYPCILSASADDSLILEEYNRAFATQLEEYGYRVFPYYESDSFFKYPGLKLLVNIAQLELEEVKSWWYDSDVFDEMEYTEYIPIRLLNLNSWIEVSIVDSSTTKQEVFFAGDSISDLIDGYFMQHQLTGNVTYYFKRFSMKPAMVTMTYKLAGGSHASDLFDVWMNRYIEKHDPVPKGSEYRTFRKGYYHYDIKKRRVVETYGGSRLIKL